MRFAPQSWATTRSMVGVLIATTLAALGCSNGDGGTAGSGGVSNAGGVGNAGSTGNAGSAGHAGSAGNAGSAGHAGSAGGSADAGVDAGPPTTCSPGTVLDPRPYEECEGDGFCRCRNYAPDGGTLSYDYSRGSNMGITSMLLTAPMKAGQPYSLSAAVTNSGYTGDIEFWGTTSECGPGLQKLFSAPIESKVFCADVMPTQDFTYVLYVEGLQWDGGAPAGEHTGDVLACPTGRCPPAP